MSKKHMNILFHKKGEHEDRWIRVGTAFHTKDGEGFNLFIDAIPVEFNGVLVMKPPFPDRDQLPEKELIEDPPE